MQLLSQNEKNTRISKDIQTQRFDIEKREALVRENETKLQSLMVENARVLCVNKIKENLYRYKRHNSWLLILSVIIVFVAMLSYRLI